ncbi:hypothetical protein C2G38_2223365 [Gigaspora rosea]|uniref:Uncharacterized protein n=1 Tax=Gigaspora rosea TaxID=44941 RepID=A0A397U331_9GLOM|nr:hypothetical protein C2G38_2223365 [Gigaspora rosea]
MIYVHPTLNKKESLNIECQSENFETTNNNNFKEIDNEFELSGKDPYTKHELVQEKNWQEIYRILILNCEYKNGNSTLFNNDQFISLTNNSEDLVIEPSRPFINRENQSISSKSILIENSITFFFAIVIFELKPILIRLELRKKDFDYILDPRQILFTQAQINSYFSGNDEFTVENTINDLVTSRLKPQDLPIIHQAIQKGANFKKVPVKIVRETNKGAGFG